MKEMNLGIALELDQLGIQFGGLKALTEVSISISEASIFGLIGPNGAGKTTLFNLLTGVYQPSTGSVKAFGKNITGLKSYQIANSGMARTFQNIRLFKELSVLDNLLIALDHNPEFPRTSLFSSLLYLPSFLEREEKIRFKAEEILRFMNLDSKMALKAKNLPYGDQRRLEIARAIATGAKIVLLDEPAAGMNGTETTELMQTIRNIRESFQVTVLLIEHDMKLVMGICERIAVLDYGVKIAEGTPAEIKRNQRVIEAYLGKEEAHAV